MILEPLFKSTIPVCQVEGESPEEDQAEGDGQTVRFGAPALMVETFERGSLLKRC